MMSDWQEQAHRLREEMTGTWDGGCQRGFLDSTSFLSHSANPIPSSADHTPPHTTIFSRDEKNVDHYKNLSILKRKRKKIKIAWNAPTLRKSTVIMLALVPSFASLCIYTHVLVYKKLVKMVIIVDAFFPFNIFT